MYVKRVLFVKRGYCGASLYKYLLSTPCPPPPKKNKKIKNNCLLFGQAVADACHPKQSSRLANPLFQQPLFCLT